MTTGSIRPGDIVRVEPKGTPPFHAIVVKKGPAQIGEVDLHKGELAVETLAQERIRFARAREITAHWRKRG